MRRCTSCFRFQPGSPTYCAYCGRSLDVRICSRGHRNPRNVQFCSECGSSELSTPTPPASFLYRISGFVLYLFTGATVAIALVAGGLTAFYRIDWAVLGPRLVQLVLVIGVLYWTTTLLPGPIKRIGRAAGRQVFRWRRNK